MKFRTLEADEYIKVAPIFLANGTVPPLPALSTIKVAEDGDGKIIAMATFQMVPHGEPIWVAPEHRGNGLAHELMESLNAEGHSYYGFVEQGNEQMAEVCRANGMTELPYRVFYKEIE